MRAKLILTHTNLPHLDFGQVQANPDKMTLTEKEQSHRFSQLKEFDETKRGVKGLVDSGVTSIPPIFLQPPEDPDPPRPDHVTTHIPAVDLWGVDSSPERRKAIAEEVSRASREIGFFQVVNHGVPLEMLDRTIGSIRGFHELPDEVKAGFYRREMGTGVSFISNVDLFRSKAASWRDTLQIKLGPTLPEIENIPEICRNEVVEWNQHCTRVAELLMELLCEGLGLDSNRFKEMTCSQGKTFVGHYYPWCPQPDLTAGLTCHTDPGVLTVLLQDHIGGLQVRVRGRWVDVKPIHGALVINIGDILQMLSNDECISIEHRVLANPSHEPRTSIAVFFNPSDREGLFGPLPELISPGKPALYRQFMLSEYLRTFFSRELGDKSLRDHFKL